LGIYLSSNNKVGAFKGGEMRWISNDK